MARETDIRVGRHIREHRWLLGMSQQQLAEAIGISFQQVQKYEKGITRVSASRLWEIAQILKAAPEDLLALEPTRIEAAFSGAGLPVEKEAFLLLHVYHVLPGEKRKALIDLAKALAVGKRRLKRSRGVVKAAPHRSREP